MNKFQKFNYSLLTSQNKIIVYPGSGEQDRLMIYCLLKNISELGFTLSQNIIDRLLTYTDNELKLFYNDLIPVLKEQVGSHRNFSPRYPNFPEQVKTTPGWELWYDSVKYYVLGILDDYEVEDRGLTKDRQKLRIIHSIDLDELPDLFKSFVNSKSSLAGSNWELLENLIFHLGISSLQYLPDTFPQREIKAFTLNRLSLIDSKEVQEVILSHLDTSTDILRFIIANSHDTVPNLFGKIKLKNIPRKQRRLIMKALNGLNSRLEDMFRHVEIWKRVGEKLHPGEFYKQYPDVVADFTSIRENNKPKTFYSEVEYLRSEEKYTELIDVLKKRPTELARRLDLLLRSVKDTSYLLEQFTTISDKVSTTVLVSLISHFKNRLNKPSMRIFFPQGLASKAYGKENELPDLQEIDVNRIVEICEESLISRFSQLEPLGKVYIDEQLKDYSVPLSMRSASRSLKQLSQGSKIPIEGGNTLRLFLWWKEGFVESIPTGRVDIDLSATYYKEDWSYLEHISYTIIKSTSFNAYHSGDITSAPNGACEFIDIDIEGAKNNQCRYIAATIFSYSSQAFCDLPECFGGWMIRSKVNSGEIFEPKTVVNKIDLAADSKIAIPLIIDVVEKKVIWTDLALTSSVSYGSNLENNQKGMVLIGKSFTEYQKPNLYDLFKLHAHARAESLVDNAQAADTIFSIDEGITPFDALNINSDFL